MLKLLKEMLLLLRAKSKEHCWINGRILILENLFLFERKRLDLSVSLSVRDLLLRIHRSILTPWGLDMYGSRLNESKTLSLTGAALERVPWVHVDPSIFQIFYVKAVIISRNPLK